MIDLRCGDCLEVMKSIPDKSVDICITSPPYYNLRDYGNKMQIGQEHNYSDYLNNLIDVFEEVKRILKDDGSLWVNIADVYSHNNKSQIKKSSLIGIPDRFKIKMIDNGWICRNEIIWHKPNAMPSSAKTRFNNDYEKMLFFVKNQDYYFDTQYEKAKVEPKARACNTKEKTKYLNEEQEKSVRQGMSRNRGNKIIKVRNNLPKQQDFVNFMRSRTNVNYIFENSSLSRTKIEHWFRRDKQGFSYPSIEDWNSIKYLIDDYSKEFNDIDFAITDFEYETDDINKNISKGRIKRAVWSISTKPSKFKHFAPFPKELVKTPIKACCKENGIVLDCFMGSGTTGVVSKELNRNFIGIELNNEYFNIAKGRIEND